MSSEVLDLDLVVGSMHIRRGVFVGGERVGQPYVFVNRDGYKVLDGWSERGILQHKHFYRLYRTDGLEDPVTGHRRFLSFACESCEARRTWDRETGPR